MNKKKASDITMRNKEQNLLKQIIIMLIVALCIGLFFGVILLKFSIKKDNAIDEVIADPPDKTTATETEEQDESTTLESLEVYVLQAGMFTEKENAVTQQGLLEEKDIPTTIWHMDDAYYLLVGVSKQKEEAEMMMKNIDEAELFIKALAIEPQQTFTADDQAFLLAFQSYWEKQLARQLKGEQIEVWQNQGKNSSSLIEQFEADLIAIHQKKSDNFQLNNLQLLEMIIAYDKLLQKMQE